MADITFYTNPMSRGRIVHWLLEELGVPYDMKILDFEKGEHKSAGVPEDQSDGQGARDRASRRRRHGVRRDLRLSRRCVPEGGAGAGARRSAARHLLALDLLRRRLRRARARRQDVRAAARRAQKRARLRQLRRHVECARDGDHAGAVHPGRQVQRRRRLRRLADSMGNDGQGPRAAAQVSAIRGAPRGAARACSV